MTEDYIQSSDSRHHTIIPAPTSVIHIHPETKREIVGLVVDITHTVASAGAVLLFLGAILTNL